MDMKQTLVRYKVKPEPVVENERCIAQVFEVLLAQRSAVST
jgi:hypothetical protein